MKTIKVRPVLVESKDIHSQLEIDDIYIGKLSYEAKQYHCKHPQELILISLEDEEINIGEVGLDLVDNTLFEVKRILTNHYESGILSFQKSYCKKVIARQSQISPKYISKFVEQYNKGCVEDFEIVMEEYFNQSIGDKVEVINNVYNFSKGDLITIKQFNYKNDCNLIEFEEDDEYKQGFHISHLNINSKFEPKLTNGFVTIVAKEPITYTEEEVKSLCSGAYSLGLSSLKSEIPDLEEMMELDNWFENNKKK